MAKSKSGESQMIRALIDQGSQSCFITESTVQFLRLKKIPVQGNISGLGNNSSIMLKYMVQLNIQSRIESEFKLALNAYVLSSITSYLPERKINTSNFDWIHTKGLFLADPEYNIPNKIDILLGADVYGSIIKEGLLRDTSSSFIAQNTSLGWVLSGVIRPENNEDSKNNVRNINVYHAQFREDEMLKKFWEIEEQGLSSKKIMKPEEQRCEEYYMKTTKRNEEGRYVVRLPFREENPDCKFGNSRAIAIARLKSLERRLSKDESLKQEYSKVLNEYLQLGHMREVQKNDKKKEEAVYLPHHAVVKNERTTTKVRVVFNASEKNRKGVSLNDTLMIGPTIQPDLRHIVLRWRTHSIGLVADIVKMYRQVRVSDEDACFQRIVWRESPEKEIMDYELLTVTFGTSSAPFLAVRTLHQVAYDEGDDYPLATDNILNCFYMDDLMTGCSNVDEGAEIYNNISKILSKGGFILQKWNSNNKELLEIINGNESKAHIDSENKDKAGKEIKGNLKEEKEVNIKLDNTIKILGLTWNRDEDSFQYSVNLPPILDASITKRSILSDIARLFDPLGWIAPSIVLAKIFIQKLWLAGVGWDENLGQDLKGEWRTYREELAFLSQIRLPRWLGTYPNDDVELHGFCDASQAAYSAVVYIRFIDTNGKVHIKLLVAKTRVAPIKQISIPRLELCGAVLLTRLLAETAEVLKINKDQIRAWSDSTIVLAWLNSHPSKWKTFVGNRVSEILSTLNSSQWFHVSTKENPADCASRGVLPSKLAETLIWFNGPNFLKCETIDYKRPKDLKTNLEESVKVHFSSVKEDTLLDRFSSLHKLIRVVAYCRRWLKKVQNRSHYLQKWELEEALTSCIRMTQKKDFAIDYLQLESHRNVQTSSSKLKSLCPYLDENGIIRVGGRLDQTDFKQELKHPIILSSSAHLTKLIVSDAHLKTLHGGLQLMLNYLRSAYWIIGARNLVKHHIRKCVTCLRHRATFKTPLMGSLPKVRCTPARPFINSGVDYAGPINLRTTKGRGHKSYKGYICLFVCMSTRALHLEVVSDMTTQAFLAAFRRFVARRGHCAQLWSDNGTTFVGASKELHHLATIQASWATYLESCGTEWHFIPPHAPNFGGLWEAGVKSTKYHLKRIIGDSTLTYEEMSTLLSQVEACLNSRPICIVNNTDPNEPLPLTPAHFLVGGPLISVPDGDYMNSNINCLTRWQLVQRMLQSFWQRWSKEYLSNLLNRYKWSSKTPEPNVGDVVLIKEDDLPPSRWMLGRILEKHTGDDNITRVVTLRTKSNIIKRPVSKVCILPVAE